VLELVNKLEERTMDSAVTEADLRELRQKFQLLEGDRKAHYEMSMQVMKENKQLIADMRESNKTLRKELSRIQKNERSSVKTSAGEAATQKELKNLEKDVLALRKNFDTLRANAEDRRAELKKLRDEASALELESRRPNQEDTPLARRILSLESRLDKAMIKFNEAQSIRKTYEQIVKRLKEERVGFDNQLSAIERALESKGNDHEELLLLSADATHAKDVAAKDLERARENLVEARNEREKELKSKKEIVSVRSDMVSRLEHREQFKNEAIAETSGLMNDAEEDKLKTSLVVSQMAKGKAIEDTQKQRAKIDVFEEAFRKIKDATGVSDVNEVIQKIISQEDTQKNLKELTKETQDKIEKLQIEKQRLAQRVEEIKYSGTGGGHRRKMVDDHEENLAQSIAKMERAKLQYERFAKILINVKAGISHLSEKVNTVRQDQKQIALNDDTVVDVLLNCENTLVSILNKINAEADSDAKKELQYTVFSALEETEVSSSRPFNQRVFLPERRSVSTLSVSSKNADARRASIASLESKVADSYETSMMDSMEIPMDDDGEEELTRERIKKASQTIISTHEKKTKRMKQRRSSKAPTESNIAPSAAATMIKSPKAR